MYFKKILKILIIATYPLSLFCLEEAPSLKTDLSPTLTTTPTKNLEDYLEIAVQTGKLGLTGVFKNDTDPNESANEVLTFIVNACDRYDTKITTVSLEDNNLKDIPEILFSFKSLKFLFLSRNQFTHLPVAITYLKNLKYLDVNQNKLTSIPKTIGSLNNLKKLFLKDNNLSHIPKSIGNLKTLEELDLSNNQIVTIPQSIEKLQKLEVLNLQNNQISFFTPSIWNLKYLSWLSLCNNPLNTETKKNLFQLHKQNPKMQIIFNH